MKKLGKSALYLSFSLLSACMVGPDYQPPQTKLPATWSQAVTGTSYTKLADMTRWWQTFNDTVLSGLIEKAQMGNLDVYQAEARLRQARANRQLSQANLLPTSSLNSSGTQTGSSEAAGSGTTNEFYRNGIDVSWEVDIFGKLRRTVEAAEATEQAAQEDLRAVLVSLCAEVALNYVDVRNYQTRLQITESNLAAQVETYDITRWRYLAGLITQLDVDQAKLTVENTRATLPVLRSSLEQAKHRIALLLGQPPTAVNSLLSTSAPIPNTSNNIAIGIPADIVRQRPDVRRAERKLAAQTAQIGVAEAARYPNFTLAGSIGLESLVYANLYTAGAKAFQLAAKSVLVLLDAGRIRANINVQNALQDQALGLYESTLLTALSEVENALTAYSEEVQRRDTLTASVAAASSALTLAKIQYVAGISDFQPVLESQRALLIAQTQLTLSEAEVAADVIRLYKALGGGWHVADTEKQTHHE